MEFLSWVRDQWDRVGAVVLVVVGILAFSGARQIVLRNRQRLADMDA